MNRYFYTCKVCGIINLENIPCEAMANNGICNSCIKNNYTEENNPYSKRDIEARGIRWI